MLDKAGLRKELLDRRDRIPPEVRRAKDMMVQERFLSSDEFRGASVVFSFVSFRTEVDTTGIIKASLSRQKRVVVPKVDRERHRLLLCEIQTFEELAPGYMGIPEPPCREAQMDINEVDIVIVPGAGFDETGNRIGYGGGYYDRLLAGMQKEVPVVAPVYEEQIVECIPSEPHDIRVQVLVSDRRLVRCRPEQ